MASPRFVSTSFVRRFGSASGATVLFASGATVLFASGATVLFASGATTP
jgi:hypothetical protein